MQVSKAAQKKIDAWKDKPIGTPVYVVRDNGRITETKTRSAPWCLGDGSTVVILLEGFSGGYLLERVRLGSPAPNAPKEKEAS